MRDYGLSTREVAEIIGRSPNTVREYRARHGSTIPEHLLWLLEIEVEEMTPIDGRWVNSAQAARAAGVTRQAIAQAVRGGALRAIRRDRAIRIRVEDLLDWAELARHPVDERLLEG